MFKCYRAKLQQQKAKKIRVSVAISAVISQKEGPAFDATTFLTRYSHFLSQLICDCKLAIGINVSANVCLSLSVNCIPLSD